MSKIEWEYDLVERPFCEQLKAMGWQWLEGDKDVPEFMGLLLGRLWAGPCPTGKSVRMLWPIEQRNTSCSGWSSEGSARCRQ